MRSVLLLLLLIVLVGCTPSYHQEQTNAIAESKVIKISVLAPSGWLLIIERDGSGQMGYGSQGTDFTKFPSGTFEFSDIISTLTKLCVSEGSISKDYAVAFRQEGQTSVTSKYFNDDGLAQALYDKAFQTSMKAGTRIEELYKTKPTITHNQLLQQTATNE